MPPRPITEYLAAAFIVVSAASALVSFLFPSPWTRGLDGAVDDTVASIRSWVEWGVVGSIGPIMSARRAFQRASCEPRCNMAR
jgi:hypothetical protein